MKYKLPVWLSVVIALALVAFGLLYGTWAGYSEERVEVVALLTMENGLMDMLGYRAADGFNLCAVAARHLPVDAAELTALKAASQQLRDAKDLFACQTADESLSQAIKVLRGLTDGSRLVGIISHVGELKTRIDRQIVITKQKTGGSTANVIA